MTSDLVHPLEKYVRGDRLPHIFCSGCGIGILLSSFARALQQTQTDLDKLVMVSGIGCIGRASGYYNADGFHTTHGRAIPFAIGVKVAKPDLNVVVMSGDGDLFAIGGNHFIHAARRNVDMLVICANNYNYGMTGGQFGPTTPTFAKTMTTPYGNLEHPFNLVHLAHAAGASFVARWTAYHARQLSRTIEKALKKRGFRFIEVIVPCPEVFGRRNRRGTALDIMRQLKEVSVIKNKADPAEGEITWGPNGETRIVVGEFIDTKKREFTEQLRDLVKQQKKSEGS